MDFYNTAKKREIMRESARFLKQFTYYTPTSTEHYGRYDHERSCFC